MKNKTSAVIFFLLSCTFVCFGFILVDSKRLTAQEPYKFKVNLQDCSYAYTAKVNSGTHFGVSAEITNIGPIVKPPFTIWLLYDNRVCDKKELDKPYGPNEILLKDFLKEDGFFSCDVELPGVPAEAKKIDMAFKFLYTVGKQDPTKEGVIIYLGNTKDFCRVCVE